MIPILNVYYLFLYAWDRFIEGSKIDVGADTSPDLPNLLAKVLIAGTKRQFSRGLDRRYIGQIDELAAPRGRFLFTETITNSSLLAGRLVCQFDELAIDTVPNRILRSTIQRLHRSPLIEKTYAEELRRLDKRLEGVAQLALTPSLFRSLQVMRHQSQYSLLMNICRLVMELSAPQEFGAGHGFVDILTDEKRMSAVFEQFLRNFYRLEQTEFAVSAETIAWPASSDNSDQLGYLPAMITDVTLRSPHRMIIIDAKFYETTFVPGRFGGPPKVRSGHLYQLQSYLEHSPSGPEKEGILLYPLVSGDEARLQFQLPRHRIRVCTVNLNQPWHAIHDELLGLVKLPSSGAAAISAEGD